MTRSSLIRMAPVIGAGVAMVLDAMGKYSCPYVKSHATQHGQEYLPMAPNSF